MARYNKELADRAVFFIQHLKHTKGEWAGQPFVLLPWQEKIIRDVFGTVKDDGYRQYNTVYIEVPKKNGKALALDTPLPTPRGWTTIGDVNVGDILFDEDGNECSVVAVTDVMYGRPCYEVIFADGERIIADEQHQWLTKTYIPWLKTGIHTTLEIKNTLGYQNGRNHKIRLPKSIKLEDKELPIPPYVLGVWLGDGSSRSASFTCSYNDYQIVEEVNRCGIETREYKSSNENSGQFGLGNGDRTQKARNKSIQADMRKLGLLHKKHIPQDYLRASVSQRLELLQGLMDTDGYISKAGQCEFTTTSEELRDGVLELLASLGLKRTSKTAIAKLNGKDCGLKYRIQFYAYDDVPVFKLKRKIVRQKPRPLRKTRNAYKKIIAVNPTKSVPVKCIQVDSPSGLFLAGKSMVPTHNSELAAAVALYLLFGDGEPGAEVYGAAADRFQASIVYNVAAQMARQEPALTKRSRVLDSIKRIVVYSSNSFYQVLSAEAFTKHGLNVHGCIFDELHTQPNRELFDVLTKGSGDARRQPLYFLITTAGIDRNSICWEVHEKARQILNGTREDPTFYPVLYGLDDDEDWGDEVNWYKVNPSLDAIIDIEKVRAHYHEAKQSKTEENVFRQLRLNQWVKQSVRWMQLDKWDASDGKVDTEKLKGQPCYAGLDLSSTTDLTALCLVFPQADGTYDILAHFWIPEETMRERERRDRVPYTNWVEQGYVTATPGNVIDYGFVQQTLEGYASEYDIKEVAFDRWGATKLSQDLTNAGFTMVEFGQGYKSMSAPTKELETLVLGRRLRHGGNPVLRWNIDNLVVKQDPAGNIKPDKQKSTQKIDGAVALIMALDRATRHSEAETSIYETEGLMII